MPELPEVETVRRGLERLVVGRRVERVEVGRERVVRRTSRAALVDTLTGTTVLGAGRRGKYLRCPLDSGDELMVHLRMSGQLLVAHPGAARPPHTHVVTHLSARPAETSSGTTSDEGPVELWFVDPRTFGEVVVFDPDNVAVEVPELARLGIDPVADPFTRRDLRRLVRSRSRRLKALLLDQHLIAGIGNIYADEILHAARLRPDRASDSLGPAAEARLHAAVVGVLAAAIDAGGSSLRDAQYVDLFGTAGGYQDAHRVYGRAGERCITCGVGWVRRTVVSQRSTHVCPRCQR
ncbi:MAG: bifunctional DNA-formamidopyrimidine glycosylase/DNA-(apurinic or apyrimidinic site) lyase [Ilumatobacteraceae bacterium]